MNIHKKFGIALLVGTLLAVITIQLGTLGYLVLWLVAVVPSLLLAWLIQFLKGDSGKERGDDNHNYSKF